MSEPTLDEKYNFSTQAINYINNLDCDYVEGMLLFCETNNIDVEDIGDLISDKLRGLIEMDANSQNLIRGKNQIIDM